MEPNKLHFYHSAKALLLGLSLLFSAAVAHASQLYQVELEGSGDVQQDQVQAFDLLLWRLTGDPAASRHPLVEKAKQGLGSYVQQFGYNQSQISVSFSEPQVVQLLTQAQLRLLGSRRPQVMVWWVQEQNYTRRLVADATQAEWLDELRQQTDRLAVPLLWPILDLQDTMAVAANDVWGHFDQVLYRASERYSAPLILSVKQFALDDVQWQLQWRLLDNQQQRQLASGQLQGPLDNLGAKAIDALAQELGQRYGVQLTEQTGEAMLLRFENVTNFTRLVRLERFLNQHPSIASISMHQMQGDKVSYWLELLSPWEELKTALDLENQLIPDQQISTLYYLQ